MLSTLLAQSPAPCLPARPHVAGRRRARHAAPAPSVGTSLAGPARAALVIGLALPAVTGAVLTASVAHADEPVDIPVNATPTTVSLGPSQALTQGQPVAVSSVIRSTDGAPLGGERVQWFITVPGGGWRYWKAAITDSNGYARWDMRPTTTMQVRARVPDTHGLAESWSAPVTLTVKRAQAAAGSRGAAVVAAAAREAGRPYVFGAAGPSAFDCSGLTMFVYREFGVSLPHYTVSQYAAVRHISRADMQPGDLIFLSEGGYLGHVGIYAGNGMMWHAPHSGDHVRLAPVYSASYVVGRP